MPSATQTLPFSSLSDPCVRPPHDLVPSRYALRVGEIDALVISDGVLPLPTATMATNADPADLARWLQYMFMPPDAFDWPLNVMVARSGDQTILIDAGLGGQFPGFPRAGQLPQRLEDAGIALESVTDVIITHMHMDHVGGLLVDGVKERLRPDVRIHVSATEVAFWTSPDFSHTVMPKPVPAVLRSTAASFYNEYRDRLRIFQDRHEVAPGVVVRITGGHTPGHSVVDLIGGDERLTLPATRYSPWASIIPTGTTASSTTPRNPPACGSVFSRNWRRTAGCWWPPICRSPPSAGWRSMATPFAGCRSSGTTDRAGAAL